MLTPGIAWLGRRFPLERGVWLQHAPVHLAAAVVALAAHLAVFAFWTLRASPYAPDAPWLGYTVSLLGSEWVFVDVFLFGLVLGGQQAWRFARQARDRELRATRLEGQLQHARFQALKMQLHPHFLFNTLNAISTLVLRGDTGRATRMLNRLSTFLRMALEERETKTVPLARELAFAEAYLRIEQVRFGDHLRVETDVDDAVRTTPVPHLLLQPIVENAIRHGIAQKDASPGTLCIAAAPEKERVRIVVEDDGPGLPTTRCTEVSSNSNGAPARNERGDARPASENGSGGLGLTTTRERLEAHYLTAHRFDVDARPDGGVRVTIEIPTDAMPSVTADAQSTQPIVS